MTYENPIDSTAVPSHAGHFLLYPGVDAEAHNVVAGPQLVNQVKPRQSCSADGGVEKLTCKQICLQSEELYSE